MTLKFALDAVAALASGNQRGEIDEWCKEWLTEYKVFKNDNEVIEYAIKECGLIDPEEIKDED